jgi:hypothetical protein
VQQVTEQADRGFSNGQPVDSVETEKSRVVLRELEKGWWILASIDLTRLPSMSQAQAGNSTPPKKGAEPVQPKATYEYSSREVSPPVLLVQQLLQAHYVFQLHHGLSLHDLHKRLPRDKFCATLDRFWTRFSRTWDVLLHGNPAADVFSGLKLASGGELGVGVGEEEWGSGEREVLEDLVQRTEGLLDLVVSRFGEPATAIASGDDSLPEHEALPWMGGGSQPMAPDGVIFGGVGAIARPSLRNISLWMRQIYTYGEHAYGVRDNPLRERRKRRRRNPPEEAPKPANGKIHPPSEDAEPQRLKHKVQQKEAVKQHEEGNGTPVDSSLLPPPDPRRQIHGRTASQDHALQQVSHTPPIVTSDRPNIPPPIVKAVDQALERATTKADQVTTKADGEDAQDSGTTWGVPDQYMKYLTFGLSEIGKSSKPPKRPPPPKQKTSASSEATIKPNKSKNAKSGENAAANSQLDEGDSIKKRIAEQKRQENKGHFVIGLKGDLDEPIPEEEAEDPDDPTDTPFNQEFGGTRTVLRTLQVEVVTKHAGHKLGLEDETFTEMLDREAGEAAEESSANSSSTKSNLQKVQVLIYVHRPFMYCFLFETRTSSLQWGGLYRQLHTNLLPIHKPLLSSTSVNKVAQRIEASHAAEVGDDRASVLSGGTNTLPAKGGKSASETNPIFDLIYDPRLLAVHTSIPCIPDPGTPAAEGLGFSPQGSKRIPSGWSRVEALNVHSAILNTLQSVRNRPGELERTSKTSRGWWIVWMKCPMPMSSDTIMSATERAEEADALAGHSTSTLQRAAGEADDPAARTVKTPPRSVPFSKDAADADPSSGEQEQTMYRTAFLVRKASESDSARARGVSSAASVSSGSRAASQGMWSSTLAAFRPSTTTIVAEEKTVGGGCGGGGDGSSGFVGGIGFDARKYMEGLMSLNR